jgi:hypothetical protein
MWYLGNLSNTCSSSSLNLSILSIFSSVGAWTFRTMISHQRPLSIMYNILSLTNSTWFSNVRKNLCIIHDSHSPFHRKMYIRLLIWCHLHPIWPLVLPLNLAYISSATALSEPALYILLTFQVPNLISILFHLGRLSTESVQVQGFLWSFITSLFFTARSH